MLDSHIIEDIERFVSAELTCRGHPGSSLSIIMRDEIVWANGFGYADIENKVEARPETVYRCASVTKPVISAGFLQLMERGKFHLDDEVNSHLDAKIQDIKGDEPTIRDLLTHRSGMPTRVPPLYLFDEEPLTMKGYLGSAARAVKSRGESYAYCNTAYMIIGYLIELFSSITYDKYVSENVLKPLEMRSSAFTLTPKIRGKLAQGYKRAGGPDKPLIPVPPYILGTLPEDPAGSLYSSVLDLANFVIMNMMGGSYKGRRVLREETVKEMHRLQAPTGISRSGMGLTWVYSIHDGHVMLNHTGGLPDYTNNVCFYPVEKVAVCWLSNLQDGSGWRPPAQTALRLACGEKPTLNETLQAVPENWDKICGLFGDDTHQVSLTVRNGYLTLNNSVLLEMLDCSRYRAHGPSNDGYEVTIEYGEDGQAKSISYGTTYLPRYISEAPEIDTSLVLEGTWRGEYHDSSGFHTLELTIENEKHGTLKGSQRETLVIEKFNAANGQVTGSFQYTLPKEYARWGTSDQVEAIMNLKAVKGSLKGFLKSGGTAIPITLTKPRK